VLQHCAVPCKLSVMATALGRYFLWMVIPTALNAATKSEGGLQQCSYGTIPLYEGNVTVTSRGVANSGCKKLVLGQQYIHSTSAIVRHANHH